jgi:hypothetical protein
VSALPSTSRTNVSGHEVEVAMAETIKLYLPLYLPVGWATPRSFRHDNDVDKWPETALPAIIIVCPGLADQPVRYMNRGEPSWRMNFAMGVAVVVSARTEAETRHFCQDYTAMVRQLVCHHPSLDGFAEGLDWIEERYDAMDDSLRLKRTLYAGITMFQVQVETLIGPRPDLPYGPVIQTSDVTVGMKED